VVHPVTVQGGEMVHPSDMEVRWSVHVRCIYGTGSEVKQSEAR
jgi:hypothetical protein